MKSMWLMCAGIALLQVDTWILQTMWLGLAGAALLIYSMYYGITKEGD